MTKYRDTRSGIETRQGATATYYEVWITPQVRVATWRTYSEADGPAIALQILDRRGITQRSKVSAIHRLDDYVHPREALKAAVPAVISMLEIEDETDQEKEAQ